MGLCTEILYALPFLHKTCKQQGQQKRKFHAKWKQCRALWFFRSSKIVFRGFQGITKKFSGVLWSFHPVPRALGNIIGLSEASKVLLDVPTVSKELLGVPKIFIRDWQGSLPVYSRFSELSHGVFEGHRAFQALTISFPEVRDTTSGDPWKPSGMKTFKNHWELIGISLKTLRENPFVVVRNVKNSFGSSSNHFDIHKNNINFCERLWSSETILRIYKNSVDF